MQMMMMISFQIIPCQSEDTSETRLVPCHNSNFESLLRSMHPFSIGKHALVSNWE